MINVSVQGGFELVRFFEKLNKAYTGVNGGLVRAVKISAVAMQRAWKIRLSGPHGPMTLGVVTGRLRRSIHIQASWDRLSALIGSDMPYARIHEFGGPIRFKSGRVLFLPARPHRKPAIDDVSEVIYLAFLGEYDKAVAEAERATSATNAGQGRMAALSRGAFSPIVGMS